MLNHTAIMDNQAFQLGMTAPVNTSATATKALRAGHTQGALAISVLAGDANVALTAGKKITISYTEGTTADGSFAAPKNQATMAVTYTTGLANIAKGKKLASLLLPVDCGKFVKAVISTDDTSAAGKLDVILDYEAR